MSQQRQVLSRELHKLAKRVAGFIYDADTTKKIPHSEWTIGDATAHLVITQHIITSLVGKKKVSYIPDPDTFVEDVRKNLSREYIAGINKKFLSKYVQRDGKMLAKDLIAEVDSFIKLTEKHDDTFLVKTHWGEITVFELYSYCLTHILIHGSSVANALHKPLPATVGNTEKMVPFVKVFMLRMFDKKAVGNLAANFIISMRDIETFVIHIEKRTIRIEDALPKNVDCYISLSPLTFFLVTNGYYSLWLALLTGKIRLGGKKPWLAFKLQTLFKGL
jgi:putative sterol carrier protein